jgi:hypothetical protein
MFVSFFYALDRSSWPSKWKRATVDYYARYEALLQTLQGKKLVMFSNDVHIQKISQKYSSCQYIQKDLDTFQAWQQRENIQKGLQKRWLHFNVPEFFSKEYIALQLCKFEALHMASYETRHPREPIVWIDAGIRKESLQRTNFQLDWTQSGIHVTQFTALPICERYITEFPGAFLMGGCFGGFGVYVRRLFVEAQLLLDELYGTEQCANDQQVLSLLFWRKPNLFHVQKAFKQYIPFYGVGKWAEVLQIIDNEEKQQGEEYHIVLIFLVILFLLFLKAK